MARRAIPQDMHVWTYPDKVTIGPLAEYDDVDGNRQNLYRELSLLSGNQNVIQARGQILVTRPVYDSIKIWRQAGGFGMALHEYIDRAFAEDDRQL